MSKFGNFASSFFQKGGQRHIDNVFTGVSLSGKGKKAAGLGMVGYGIYTAVNFDDLVHESQVNSHLAAQAGTPVTSLPGTYGDGQDYMSRLRDMQSQSELVFALDKLSRR